MKKLLKKLFLSLAFTVVLTGCDSQNGKDIFDDTNQVNPPHEHTYSDVWSYDETDHWHKATCEHTDLVKDKEHHHFELVEDVAPTYTQTGRKKYQCHECFYSYTEIIGALEHTYSDKWSSDRTGHWHACIDEGFESIKGDFSAHTFTAETTEPTYETPGKTVYTCSICSYSYEVSISPLEHNYEDTWSYNETGHYHKCIDEGYEDSEKADFALHSFKVTTKESTFEEVGSTTYTCVECGYSYSVEIAKKEHTYSDKLTSDANGHWYPCVDKGYENEKKDYEQHDYLSEVTEPTYDKKGYTTYTCKKCGYTYDGDETPEKDHHFEEEWTNDAYGHWHACTDDGYENLKGDYSVHNYEIDTIEPTLFDGGLTTHTCKECGFSYETEIDSIYNQSIKKSTFRYISESDSYAFTGTTADIKILYIPDYYDGKPVTRIDRCALNYYGNQSLQKIYIGNNVNYLDYYCFGSEQPLGSLKFLHLGDSLTSFDIYAYSISYLEELFVGKMFSSSWDYSIANNSYYNNLKTVTVSEENNNYCSVDGIVYSKDKTMVYFCPRNRAAQVNLESTVTSIYSNCTFSNCKFSTIILPGGLTSLPYECFYQCINLDNITLPSSLVSIGAYAFQLCQSLVSVDIPDNVTSIGDCAFSGCYALKKVRIGASVSDIRGNCFSGCNLESLTVSENNTNYKAYGNSLYSFDYSTLLIPIFGDDEPNYPEQLTTFGSNAFSGSNIESFVVPEGVTAIDTQCFSSCYYLKTITLPSTLTYIGNSAFFNCNTLTSISIPSNVTYLGTQCFCDCYALTSIEIPDSVTTIDYGCFYCCYALTTVKLSNSITYIPGSCFYECQNLSSINIPDSVTYIDSWAFQDAALTSLVIPSSVNNLYNGAFYNCNKLESVVFSGSNTQINSQCFAYCNKLKSCDLPASLTSLPSDAFFNCYLLKNISIPSTVTYIGSNCFYNCTALEEVDFNNAPIDVIEYYSFYNCPALTNLTNFNFGSLHYVWDYAFNDSPLVSIYLTNSLNYLGYHAFYNTSTVYFSGTVEEFGNLNMGVFNENVEVIYV